MKPRHVIYILVLLPTLALSQFSTPKKAKPIECSLKAASGRFAVDLVQGEQSFILRNLRVGRTYHIHVNSSSMDPFGGIAILNNSEKPVNARFELVATSNEQELTIKASRAGFGHISVACFDCHTGYSMARMPGPIATQGGSTAEELITDVLIGGDCFDVQNVTFQGTDEMIGTFSNGDSNIGMNEGIVLTTGRITQIPGPNSTTSISDDMGQTAGDVDLAQISVNTLFDIAKIEFDFIPKSDRVEFRYAFASDEYCDFNFTDFNDKFGFFISGPGINGPFSNNAENIAIVPGLAEFVSINTVNLYQNEAYYVDNVPQGQQQSGPFDCVNDILVDGYAITEIEYDGFTVVLTAEMDVIPCETYHIKLAIADQGDGIFDSAVFLEAGSFSAGDGVAAEVEYSRPGDDFVYEGCSDGFITFTRGDPNDVSTDFVIDYSILPTSTATPDIDYQALPLPIIIPAGQVSVQVPLIAFQDNLTEGIESIIIELTNSCRCSSDQIEILISDVEPLAVSAESLEFCEPTGLTLTPTITGGLEPYNYAWSTGETTESINITLTESDTFYVTVTDDCGSVMDTSFIIEILDPSTFQFSSTDLSFCPADIIDETIEVIFSGPTPITIEIYLNGNPYDVLVANENTVTFQATESGIYTFGVVTSDECTIFPSGQFEINRAEIENIVEVEHVICNPGGLGTVTLTTAGDNPPFVYQWSDNFVTSSNIVDLLPDQYTVTITDVNGCFIVDSVEVLTFEGPEIIVDSIVNISCIDSVGYISLSANGGSGNYTFNWVTGNGQGASASNLDTGTYVIEVLDVDYDCSEVITVNIQDLSQPFNVSADDVVINCRDSIATLLVDLPDSSNYSITWYNNVGNALPPDSIGAVMTTAAGIYIAEVTNIQTGCVTSDQATVIVNFDVPLADAGPNLELGCTFGTTTIDGSNSQLTANTVIEWTTTDGNIISGMNAIEMEADALGTYILTMTDTISQCFSSDTVVLITNDLPTIAISPTTILNCANSSALTTAETDDISNKVITWAGQYTSTDDPYEVLANDTGWLVVMLYDTVTQCQAFDSVRIAGDFEQPIASTSATDTLTCAATELTITASGSSVGNDYTYTWSTSQGAISGPSDMFTATISAPGWYFIEVTDTTNGCSAMDSVLISPDENLPVIALQQPGDLTCNSQTLYISSEGSDTGENYIYTWSTNDGHILSGIDSSAVHINTAGTYTLQLLNTENGCSRSQSITINENTESPLISFGPQGILSCINQQLTINAEGSSMGSFYSYQWTTPDGSILSGGETLAPLIDQAGLYILEITNSINGCVQIDSISIDADFSEPDLTPQNVLPLTCTRTETQITAEVDSQGNYTFDWTLPDNTEISDGPATINVNQIGNVRLTVTSISSGCSQEIVYVVDQDIALPTINLPPNFIVDCGQFTTSIEATTNLTDNYSVAWSTSNGNIIENADALVVTVDQTGSYEIVLTNTINGCQQTDSITVENNGEISADVNIIQPTCETPLATVNLSDSTTGTPPYSYQITPLGSTGTDWPIELPIGVYSIEVTDAAGCRDVVSAEILSVPEIELFFEEIDILNFGDRVQLFPQINFDTSEIRLFVWEPSDYLFSPNDFYPFAMPDEDIVYTLTIIDENGCEVAAETRLAIDKTVNYYIPNAFTPNDDGVNDGITIFANENIAQIKVFQIFNRWGDRVFEKMNFAPNNPALGWDGRFKNQLMDPAVFVYYAELETVFGEIVRAKGDFTLLR